MSWMTRDFPPICSLQNHHISTIFENFHRLHFVWNAQTKKGIFLLVYKLTRVHFWGIFYLLISFFFFFWKHRRGISDSLSLALKSSLKSHQMAHKKGVWVKTLSFWTNKVVIWWFFNDNFRAREESERKKEPQIPHHSIKYVDRS